MVTRSLKAEELKWLVCPVCHQALQLSLDTTTCQGCGRRYPLIDGIPVLLADRVV
jgi:uncharacterized protein YbaR (Trm112 family)